MPIRTPVSRILIVLLLLMTLVPLRDCMASSACRDCVAAVLACCCESGACATQHSQTADPSHATGASIDKPSCSCSIGVASPAPSIRVASDLHFAPPIAWLSAAYTVDFQIILIAAPRDRAETRGPPTRSARKSSVSPRAPPIA
jgi:hypothetical protein